MSGNKLCLTDQAPLEPGDYEGAVCQITGINKLFSIHELEERLVEDSNGKLEPKAIIDLGRDCDLTGVQSPCKVKITKKPFLFLSSLHRDPRQFYLPVKFQFEKDTTSGGENLESYISHEKGIEIFLSVAGSRKKRVIPDLIQGPFFGFLLMPMVQSNADEKSGEGSLILWIENRTSNKANPLAGSFIRTILPESKMLYNFCWKASEAPFTTKFKTGLLVSTWQLDELDESKKQYKYGWVSHSFFTLILEEGNTTLYFDDQDFSRFVNGNSISVTAHLKAKLSSKKGAKAPGNIQGPVVVEFTKKKSEPKILVEVKRSYYGLNQIKAPKTLDESSPPDAYFKGQASSSSRYLQHAALVEDSEISFVALECDKEGVSLVEILEDKVPLNFCLEPGAIGPISRMDSFTPQLIHRQLFGMNLRYDLVGKLWPKDKKAKDHESVIKSSKKDLNDLSKHYWLLSPIGENEKGQIVLMRDLATVEEQKDLPQLNLQTESVLVFNRPKEVSNHVPKSPCLSIANASIGANNTGSSVIFNQKKIEGIIEKKGASGFIVHRKIAHDGQISYALIPSPFYEQIGEEHKSRAAQDSKPIAQPTESAFVDTDALVALDESPSSAIEMLEANTKTAHFIDRRLLSPREAIRILSIDPNKSYSVTRNSEPLGKCAISRSLSYVYQEDHMADYYGVYKQNGQDIAKQPSIHCFESPAFKTMDPLWHLPPKEQSLTESEDPHKRGPLSENYQCDNLGNEEAERFSAYFLPYRLDIKYGVDKPGSAFHHQMRRVVHHHPYLCTKEQRQLANDSIVPIDKTKCEIGRGLDFIARDPQQVKVVGCVNAAVENLTFEFTDQLASDPLEKQILKTRVVKASWDDIFGKIDLKRLPESFSFKDETQPGDPVAPAEPTEEDGEASDTSVTEEASKPPLIKGFDENSPINLSLKDDVEPFEVLWQHNYDVFQVQNLDAAVPAYVDDSGEIKWWANLYLAAEMESFDRSVRAELEDKDKESTYEIPLKFKPYLAVAKVPIKGYKEVKPADPAKPYYEIKLDIEKGTEGIEDLKSLKKAGCRAFISGVLVRGDSPEPWEYEITEKGSDVILSFVSKPVHLKGTKEVYFVVKQEDAFKLIKEERKTVTVGGQTKELYSKVMGADLQAYVISNKYSCFQFFWLAVANNIRVSGDAQGKYSRLASCPLYPIDKFVKQLMPAITSPKVSGVLRLEMPGHSYNKTAFFGSAAAPEDVVASLARKGSDHHLEFKVYAPDKEKAIVALPKSIYEALEEDELKVNFFLVKYLVRGQVVYAEYSKP